MGKDVTVLTKEESHYHVHDPYAHGVKPHPDGKPWDKCCSSEDDTDYFCQCLMRKPHARNSRYEENWKTDPAFMALKDTGGRFFCCHRKTEDGFNRECAGWHAKFNSKKTEG